MSEIVIWVERVELENEFDFAVDKLSDRLHLKQTIDNSTPTPKAIHAKLIKKIYIVTLFVISD